MPKTEIHSSYDIHTICIYVQTKLLVMFWQLIFRKEEVRRKSVIIIVTRAQNNVYVRSQRADFIYLCAKILWRDCHYYGRTCTLQILHTSSQIDDIVHIRLCKNYQKYWHFSLSHTQYTHRFWTWTAKEKFASCMHPFSPSRQAVGRRRALPNAEMLRTYDEHGDVIRTTFTTTLCPSAAFSHYSWLTPSRHT